jgi:hypothetical protein
MIAISAGKVYSNSAGMFPQLAPAKGSAVRLFGPRPTTQSR